MTVREIADLNGFEVVNEGENGEQKIEKVFCCDLLSIAMGRAPADCAWVTVMGNINTLAVASLAGAACVILAEGVELDEVSLTKAGQQGIWVFKTEQPVFEAALNIHERL